jgi:hypothetical protein
LVQIQAPLPNLKGFWKQKPFIFMHLWPFFASRALFLKQGEQGEIGRPKTNQNTNTKRPAELPDGTYSLSPVFSEKWRELIKKVWEADPLMCPRCAHEMRIVSLSDDRAVIEQILRHLGLWPACRDARGPGRQEGVWVHTGSDPPLATVVEPSLDDPFPDYDTGPVLFANG